MFAEFLRRLTESAPAPLPKPDAQLALAALLVRVARSDGIYEAAEIALIDQGLSRQFGLSQTAATELRGSAEQLEAEAPDTVRFTRAIKEHVAYEDREGVIEALWEVVLADGVRDDHEDALLRMIAPLLGLTDQESARARQRVEARRG